MRLRDDDDDYLLTPAEIDSALVPDSLLGEVRCGRLEMLPPGPAGEQRWAVTAQGEAYYNRGV